MGGHGRLRNTLALVCLWGTLAALGPLCASASGQTQEIARIPIERPCVVVVERTADGGVRVVLEFAPVPSGPVDPDKPKPPPDAMSDAVASGLAVIPAHLHARVLANVVAGIDYAIGLDDSALLKGEVSSVATTDGAIGAISGRTLSLLGADGPPNAAGIVAIASALEHAPGSDRMKPRLLALRKAVESFQ